MQGHLKKNVGKFIQKLGDFQIYPMNIIPVDIDKLDYFYINKIQALNKN